MSTPIIDWRGPVTEAQIERAASEVMEVFGHASRVRFRRDMAAAKVMAAKERALPVKATGPGIRIHSYLSRDAYVDLERMAGRENVALSEILRRAVTEYLARYGPPGAKDAAQAEAG